jgi:hypothetical protein
MARKGDDTLGFVGWRRRSYGPHSPCWIVSIGLKPEARGHGHGTEAQRQLTRYLFAHTTANRIEAGTEITNVGEQRALERAGFTREGVLRGALCVTGPAAVSAVQRGAVRVQVSEQAGFRAVVDHLVQHVEGQVHRVRLGEGPPGWPERRSPPARAEPG